MYNGLPPSPPPTKDALYQALSPLPKAMSDRQRIEEIMRKYGKEPPRDQPRVGPRQWVGDNHA